MDVVANYAAGEEAVGAFFSCEGEKGKRPVDEDGTPNRGLKKNKKKRPWSGRSLEAPQMGVFLTRCSKSHALTIREAPTTSSRIIVC